jgi:hypothetical protein
MSLEEKFVKECLVPTVLNALLGEDDEGAEIRETAPSRKIFTGTLYPRKIARTYLGKEANKIKPCTMRAVIMLTDIKHPEDVKITVVPRFNVYFRADRTVRDKEIADEIEEFPGITFRRYRVTNLKFELKLRDALTVEGVIDKRKIHLDVRGRVPRQLIAQVRVHAQEVKEKPGTCKLTIEFINASRYSQVRTDLDPVFFNPVIKVRVENANIKPRKLKFLSEKLRRPVYEDAGTLNCTAEILDNATVQLTQVPIHYQPKRRPKKWKRPAEITHSPLRHLKELLSFLEESKELVSSKDRGEYAYVLANLKRGIELLENDENTLKAFILTNETFNRLWKDLGYSWYIYQMVYFVSIIPAIVNGENRDVADVLNVPTGWGKTEAYMAPSLFAAFHDRIMGVTPRVATLIKLPLRMLTLQQFERIVKIIATAERVRREYEISGEPIGVGFYVGRARGRANTVEEARRLSQKGVIRKCPYCGGQVEYVYDEKQHRINHQCTNCKEILPVFSIDEEIYRYLPPIVVSTLDKLPATAPVQRNVKVMFGAPLQKCPDHGYTPKNRCIVYTCGSTLIPVGRGLGPALLVQDELHMVREETGTLDSHYETFFIETAKRYTGQTPKVIGSTATISGVKHQIKNLYGLKAKVFPPKGSEEVFYEKTGEVQRVIVGIMPHGRVTKFATYRVVECIVKALRHARDNPNDVAKKIGISTKELLDILKKYWQTVAYSLTRRDAYGLLEGVENELNEDVFKAEPIRFEHITGEDSLEELARKVDRIDALNVQERPQLIVVTKIMSHGIHFPLLNLIVFQGMPRSVSEFMQMMSRIGREVTGAVFIVFYPTRERDVSYYDHFKTFFRSIDEMIEEIPIHRFSRGAITMTLSPIAMAGLISFITTQAREDYYYRDRVVRHLNHGEFPSELFEEYMREAYRAHEDDTGYYDAKLHELLENLKHLIRMRRDKFTVDAIGRGERINLGLRGMKEEVEINPRTEFIEALTMLPKPMFTGRDEEVEEIED